MPHQTFDFGELRSALNAPRTHASWARVCGLLDAAHATLPDHRVDELLTYVSSARGHRPHEHAWCPRRWVESASRLCRVATHFALESAEEFGALLVMPGVRIEGIQVGHRVQATDALRLLYDHAPTTLRSLEVHGHGLDATGAAYLSRVLTRGRTHGLTQLAISGRWFDGMLDLSDASPIWELERLDLLTDATPGAIKARVLDRFVRRDLPGHLTLGARGPRVAPPDVAPTSAIHPKMRVELVGLDMLTNDSSQAYGRWLSGVESLGIAGGLITWRGLMAMVCSLGGVLNDLSLRACAFDTVQDEPMSALTSAHALRVLDLTDTGLVGGRTWVPTSHELDVLHGLESLERVTWPGRTLSVMHDIGHTYGLELPHTPAPPSPADAPDDVLALLSDDGQLAMPSTDGLWSVGRYSCSDIVFNDPTVSRAHLKILGHERWAMAIDVSGRSARVGAAGCMRPMDQVSVIGRGVRLLYGPHHELERLRLTHRPLGRPLRRAHLLARSGHSFIALDTSVIDVGRLGSCDLVIEEPHVSRRHAQLLSIKGDYFARDLDSSAGTYLNGEQVVGMSRSLEDGDVLSFSSVEFVFRNQDISILHTSHEQHSRRPTNTRRPRNQ